MRHQPHDAAVAVEKWVDPREAMVCRGGGENRVGLAKAAIDFFEAFQEARYRGRADGDVAAHHDIAVTQLTLDDPYLFLRYRVFDPQEIVGQHFAKAAM